MKTVLGTDLLPMLERLLVVLATEPDVVRQQQLLECLIARHAMRMGSRQAAMAVVDGVHKHVRQLIEQEL